MEDIPKYLAANQVEIVASLPCYLQENVDKQRGKGTFDESVQALIMLNRLGYGIPDSNLNLNLVYNPVGPHLPPEQQQLEQSYKERLKADHGIVFNSLYTITNMPIKRYAKYLKAFGQLEEYQHLLYENYNASTLDHLMCRNTLSISWDGKCFDCDFNQMLDMQMKNGKELTVHDIDLNELKGMEVLKANHCYGCTAGAGSSCGGSLA